MAAERVAARAARKAPAAALPSWFRPALLALAAILLVGWFSPEISDSDFWWHLATGKYIAEHRALPVPDPFAYTTARAGTAYLGEERTRYFNLTHEWLAQALFYSIYRLAGCGGIVMFRAVALAAFCAVVGLVSWRRCGGFYRAVLAAFASGAVVASGFTTDRPFLLTFLFLALTVAILESRRWMWALPPLFLLWANCHGGYFLGWMVLGAYVVEVVLPFRVATPLSFRAATPSSFRAATVRERSLLIPGTVAFLASCLNPNGFRIAQILFFYRSSFMQSKLLEWVPPALWPPTAFSLLLFGAAATMLWGWRRVRLADWLLFAAFAAAALAAQRNTILIGFMAPILIATYLPWKPLAHWAIAALVVGVLISGIARGRFFELRAADWKYPSGAADFLLAHEITQPMFNTYEYGGYLMWRLWPQQRVFIDGRALSEAVFIDYARILYNHEANGGKSAQELLDQYGVEVIVMNGFEYVNGVTYLLAPALADPQQTIWKLVYSEPEAMVFMRQPPAGVQPLNSLRVLDNLEAECGLHLQSEPQYPRCARALGQVFAKIGDPARERRWIGIYLTHHHAPDPEAEQTYRQLLSSGY